MTRRVLVTGGAGFIGSHVVDALWRTGDVPVIFDRVRSPWHDRREVESVIGDLCDTARLTAALEGCDAVVHLAAAADVDQVTAHPLAAERVNARGTASVLEAARDSGVGRVVYASTIWVYSDVDAEVVDEDTPLLPPAHLYSATKLTGELYCRAYRELYGVESVVLRFGIPYGPRARPTAVVPAMVARALAGEPLTVAGDGLQTRRFVYVEDLADGVVRALMPGAAHRTYNLVGSRDVSIREVAETVRNVVGHVEITHVPGRNGDYRGAEVDGSRAARELGWTPVTGFADGVRRYVTWLEREAPVPPRSRVAEALPRLRRVMAPVAVLGALAAVLAAAGSVEQVVDEAPVAAEAMATALPLALVARMEPEAAVTRRLGASLLALAFVLACWMVLPLPGGGPMHEHRVDTLLVALSSAAAGILASATSMRPRAGG